MSLQVFFHLMDKASPEVIQREFGLSKGAFKRAIGHLMKEGKVEIKDKRILREIITVKIYCDKIADIRTGEK